MQAVNQRARTAGIRPEIQALRAVAVLIVVVCHTWPDALPGGYVGVDVFFVISGFLITSHLLREIDRTGTVCVAAFWARRARRILPAAFAILLCCAVATVALVPENLWQQYLTEVRFSTGYVENWHLADVAVDYFAADVAPSPVRHFWSLSAEEQFYLVWPLLILAALVVSRREPAARRRRVIAVALSLLAVLSLAYSFHETWANPARAYFVTPARAWEFAAGGLLALVPQSPRLHPALRPALSWAGILLIAGAAAVYSVETPFPGSAALVPVVGALAVMWAGAPRSRWAPTPVLGLPPIQFLGDISYSVYLWHWPLLVFAPLLLGVDPGTSSGLVIVALTVVAAWLTKVGVEDPVRTGPFLTRRRPRWTFAFVAVGTSVVLAVTASAGAHLERQVREAERVTARVLSERPACFGAAARDPENPCRNPALRHSVVPTPLEARNRPNAPCKIERTDRRLCAFGVPADRARTTIALVGDSHASHWRAAVEEVAQAKAWRGLSITHSGCPLSKAVKNLREPDRSSCVRWNRDVLSWFKRHPEVTTVFVSQISGGRGVIAPPGRDRFEAAVAGYRRAWRALPKSVERVIVIRDTPKAATDTASCVQRAITRHRRAGLVCALPRRRVLDPDPAAVAALRMRSPRVRVVDLTHFICDRRRCHPVVGGALVYKDQHHLTAVFATTLGPYLLRKVERMARP